MTIFKFQSTRTDQQARIVLNIRIWRLSFVWVLGFAIWSFFTLFASAQEWQLHWSRELPARKPAWQFTQRMGRDTGYAPAVAGDLMIVGCEHNGVALALDRETGDERWRFYTAAPIRVAPIASKTHVFIGSADGFLCCLDHNGKLAWKLRGGPSDRLVIGHDRMMSAWPISTRPLLHEGELR